MSRSILATALVALAACSPAAPPPPEATPSPSPAIAAPTPPAGLAEAMTGCTWTETRGAGVSMWSFACPTDDSPLVADAALPGIMEEVTDQETGQVQRYPVVQLFDIAEGADMASILPAVRAASPAPGNEDCVFVAAEATPDNFELRPTGALMAKYRLFLDGQADEYGMPCGQMGPSEGGQRLFFRLPGSATKVALVFMPSDMAIFDPDTIRAAD